MNSVWKPRESTKNIPAEVDPMTALRRSLNRPLLRMAELSGFEELESYLKGYFENLKTPLAQYPSQLLGAIDITLDQLVAVYEKFPRNIYIHNIRGSAFSDTVTEMHYLSRRAILMTTLQKNMRLKMKLFFILEVQDIFYILF